ncbi:hypothetical protein BO85DRAFT_228595 [Aspergillus piperis CBS 112811]|uniref:Uncharacterized protein n=1 Tax=Aspergillus piperis CBS 112811 TaxID=1448313 RepID=A0A8G1R8B6_9EURO|nr:hypothetical protein BO85DRAFT_228595 [Aspergillus piperis CBS 112811]RAH60481.1 hypothetical protein BO85DRAFT_228595 [Aspergillus piperis CBS 112811]
MCIRYYIRANDHKIINKILPARQQSILAGHYHALLEGLHSSAAASASASLGTSPALALLAAAAGALVFAVSSGASSASSSPSGASSSSSSTPFSSSPFSASPFSLPSSSSSSCSGTGAVFRFLEAGGAARRRLVPLVPLRPPLLLQAPLLRFPLPLLPRSRLLRSPHICSSITSAIVSIKCKGKW